MHTDQPRRNGRSRARRASAESSLPPRSRARRAPAKRSLPPLENGDRLTRAEFERRYEASPPNVKAELIDGVVFMSSPTKHRHASFHWRIVEWLAPYSHATPGTEGVLEPTLRLDDTTEPEPDALLRLTPEAGGSSRVEDGYLAGAVELIVEVAASSAAIDLHQKKDAYLRNGIGEYVVVLAHSEEVLWFVRGESGWVPLEPDARDVFRSRIFPGLWLDGGALLEGNGARVLAVLERGLASKAHASFKRTLASRARSKKRKR